MTQVLGTRPDEQIALLLKPDQSPQSLRAARTIGHPQFTPAKYRHLWDTQNRRSFWGCFPIRKWRTCSPAHGKRRSNCVAAGFTFPAARSRRLRLKWAP